VGTVIRVDHSKKPLLVSAPSASATGPEAGGERSWWYAAAALEPAPAAESGAAAALAADASIVAAAEGPAAASECAEEVETAAAAGSRRRLDGLLLAAAALERMALGRAMPAWFGGYLRGEEALDEREAGWVWGTVESHCITVTEQVGPSNTQLGRLPGPGGPGPGPAAHLEPCEPILALAEACAAAELLLTEN
jgi:hypothetical protein